MIKMTTILIYCIIVCIILMIVQTYEFISLKNNLYVLITYIVSQIVATVSIIVFSVLYIKHRKSTIS